MKIKKSALRALVKECITEFLGHSQPRQLGDIEIIKMALQRVQFDKNQAVGFLKSKAQQYHGSQQSKQYLNAADQLSAMSNNDIKSLISVIRESPKAN